MPDPQVFMRSPPVSGVLSEAGGGRRRSIGEVAGGAAADLTAVACCFPCAVVDLAVLAVYKVPAGLCRKAWRKNRQQRVARRRRAMSMPAMGFAAALEEEGSDLSLMRSRDCEGMDDIVWESDDVDSEMWDQFYANGFWRSDHDDHHHDHHLHPH